MEEIIVIRARDPDGSVFKAVMDSLKGKRAEVVDVAAPATSVLRNGEYAMLYCMASSPGQVFSKAQLYEAAWGEEYLRGTNSVENTIWRLRRKLEEDPRHPAYIKTVVGTGYRLDYPH